MNGILFRYATVIDADNMRKFVITKPRKAGSEENLLFSSCSGERPLRDEERPLDVAIRNGHPPTFIVKASDHSSRDIDGGYSSTDTSHVSKDSGHSSDQPGSCSRSNVQEDQQLSVRNQISYDTHSCDRKNKRFRSLRKLSSNMFSKRWSLRNRREEDFYHSELSTERTAPGVLKIFGPSVYPGAEYKSVLASPQSTASELVKEALERYSLPRDLASQYVLCDVIGKLSQKDIEVTNNKRVKGHKSWTEECVRVVGDNEKPLILQSFWKPGGGYSRRFELRRKEQVSMLNEKDTTTSGINANARRLLLTKTDKGAIPATRSQGENPSVTAHSGQVKSTSMKGQNSLLLEQNQMGIDQEGKPSIQHTGITSRGRIDGPKQSSSSINHPGKNPYLVVISGNNSANDRIFYELKHPVTVVGSCSKLLKSTDILLTAPDINPIHCHINKNLIEDIYVNTPWSWAVSVEPKSDCCVQINRMTINEKTELKPGELVWFGSSYVLMLKDPQSNETESSSDLTTRLFRHFRLTDEEPDDELKLGESALSSPTIRKHLLDSTQHTRNRSKDSSNGDRKRLSYVIQKEDELVNFVMNLCERNQSVTKMSPSYLFAVMLDYSADNFDQIQRLDLVEKIGTAIQNKVWETANGICCKYVDRTDTVVSSRELIDELSPIFLWMNNSLELLHYFSTEGRRHQSITDVARGEEEDFLSVLEEVVMYCFQQVVYYVTKALYPVLPAIIDSNPFQDEQVVSGDTCRPRMEDFLGVLSRVQQQITSHKLHHQLASQLYRYVFYFINASLCNSLMARGAGLQYYKWARGVQIRGNLDQLEGWAAAAGIQDEAAKQMLKVNSLANLLSVPKSQLLQCDWSVLRKLYPSLSERQLHKLLSEYHLGPGKQRPPAWTPPDKDRPVVRSDNVLESLTEPPPFVLPKDKFTLDLSTDVQDQTLLDVLYEISAIYGPAEDDCDSGLSLSHNLFNLLELKGQMMYTGKEGVLSASTDQPWRETRTGGRGTSEVVDLVDDLLVEKDSKEPRLARHKICRNSVRNRSYHSAIRNGKSLPDLSSSAITCSNELKSKLEGEFGCSNNDVVNSARDSPTSLQRSTSLGLDGVSLLNSKLQTDGTIPETRDVLRRIPEECSGHAKRETWNADISNHVAKVEQSGKENELSRKDNRRTLTKDLTGLNYEDETFSSQRTVASGSQPVETNRPLKPPGSPKMGVASLSFLKNKPSNQGNVSKSHHRLRKELCADSWFTETDESDTYETLSPIERTVKTAQIKPTRPRKDAAYSLPVLSFLKQEDDHSCVTTDTDEDMVMEVSASQWTDLEARSDLRVLPLSADEACVTDSRTDGSLSEGPPRWPVQQENSDSCSLVQTLFQSGGSSSDTGQDQIGAYNKNDRNLFLVHI